MPRTTRIVFVGHVRRADAFGRGKAPNGNQGEMGSESCAAPTRSGDHIQSQVAPRRGVRPTKSNADPRDLATTAHTSSFSPSPSSEIHRRVARSTSTRHPPEFISCAVMFNQRTSERPRHVRERSVTAVRVCVVKSPRTTETLES